MTKGRVASPELVARLQAALDSGLTSYQIVTLITEGRVTEGCVIRAIRGDRLTDRTIRALTRCCDEFDRRRGVQVPPKAVVAPSQVDARTGLVKASRVVVQIDPRTRQPVETVQVFKSRGKIDNVLQLAEELLTSTEPKRLDVLYHVYQARKLLGG